MFLKNTAVTGFTFSLVNKADGSAVTSGTVNGYVYIPGSGQSALTNTPAHVANGQWAVNLTAAELNADAVGLLFTHVSAIPVHFTIRTATTSTWTIGVCNYLLSLADNSIMSSKFQTDAISANALSAGAVNEIVDQVWRELLADHSGTAGSTAARLAALATASDAADQVWEEAIGDHQATAGSTAASLAAAALGGGGGGTGCEFTAEEG